MPGFLGSSAADLTHGPVQRPCHHQETPENASHATHPAPQSAAGLGSALALALALAGGRRGRHRRAQHARARSAQNSQASFAASLPAGCRRSPTPRPATIAAARAQVPALIAAIETRVRPLLRRQLLLARRQAQGPGAAAAGPRADAGERQGGARTQVGQFQFFLGSLALTTRATTPRRAPRCRRRIAAGYTGRQSRRADRRIRTSSEGAHPQGLDYLRSMVEQRVRRRASRSRSLAAARAAGRLRATSWPTRRSSGRPCCVAHSPIRPELAGSAAGGQRAQRRRPRRRSSTCFG